MFSLHGSYHKNKKDLKKHQIQMTADSFQPRTKYPEDLRYEAKVHCAGQKLYSDYKEFTVFNQYLLSFVTPWELCVTFYEGIN